MRQLIYCLMAVLPLVSCGSKSSESDVVDSSKDKNTILHLENSSDNKAVDLGLSVLWADRNVGASNCKENGDYYTFEEADSAVCSMGSGWRLPTKTELEELENNCSWSWTDSGYNITGPNGNSIYLPAAGWCGGSSTSYVGKDGSYWSSTPDDNSGAYGLDFNSSGYYVGWSDRSYGNSLRPVTEK